MRTHSGHNRQSEHRFSQTPNVEGERSVLNRSSSLSTTFNESLLVPVYLDEILPGDTITMRTKTFCRLATPLKPFMDNVYLTEHWWFAPMRILWKHAENFFGEQDQPDDTTEYTIPILDHNGAPDQAPFNGQWWSQSLGDYLGIPPGVDEPHPTINALPFRMYHKVFGDWYRDQNLVDRPPVGGDGTPATERGDGPDDPMIYAFMGMHGTELLHRRGKRHDYFCAALPWSQKGDAVELPLGQNVPVIPDSQGYPEFEAPDGEGPIQIEVATQIAAPGTFSMQGNWTGPDTGLLDVGDRFNWLNPGLEADMANALSATVNELRTAFAIQRLFERDARGGTRYVEILRSHFHITNHPDARLQRAEFISGSETRIHVNPVASTFNDASAEEFLGDLGAYAVGHHSGRGWSHSFVEHGYLMCIVSVRADQTYQQGLHKLWTRQDKLDFYWPALAHLGEQPIINRELFLTGVGSGSDGEDEDVFGYIPRYDEYRYKPSQLTGLMRSNVSAGNSSLDVWNLSWDFDNRPYLDDTFINDRSALDRAVAVQDEPRFLFNAFFECRHARVMPVHGTPGYIDHF